MATFKRSEEIEGWQKARLLTKEVYTVSNQGLFARDYSLRDQMRRATVSILSNIAEGFERNGTKEFIHFLSIAKGSVGEVRAQLYVAVDLSYIDQPTFDRLNTLAIETGKTLGGLMSYLQKTEITGAKYK